VYFAYIFAPKNFSKKTLAQFLSDWCRNSKYFSSINDLSPLSQTKNDRIPLEKELITLKGKQS
jgi:hypothetical protein